MTTVPPPDARAILDRVRVHIDAIARDSGQDPLLQGMPEDIARHELPLTARRYYSTALRLMHSGRQLSDADLDLARRRAAQRAEEGMPLDLVLHNWSHAARVLWQACIDAAGDDLLTGLGYLGHQLAAFQDVAVRAVTESYQARQAALRDEELGAGRLIAQALLSGQETRHEAARLGLTLASRYAILTLDPPPLASPPGDRVSRQVAARRRVRLLATALSRHSGHGALSVLDADRGQVLLPVAADEGQDAVAERARVLHLAVRTDTRLDIVVSLTDAAELPQLPQQALTGAELIRLARASGGIPHERVHRIADHALAFQLTRPSPAQAVLTARLAPLRAHPELLATLRAWLAQDLDRARTARSVNVHTNTVNNRLRRIGQLLDTDLSSFTALAEIAAALTLDVHRNNDTG
ncbi:PucR family transcriptional regulator [Streptomyces fractus]|uniref:PucR family transcriptional regulator n=1 Tax=Streptomyces fractus TaxID=641806 RepID=UPI003CF4C78A